MSIPAIITVCSEVVRHVARGAVHGPFRGIRRHVSHLSHHVAHHGPRHIIPPRLEIACHVVGAGLMGTGVAALGMTAGAALAPPPALVADAGAAGQTGQSPASGQGGGAATPAQGAGAPFQSFAGIGQPPDLATPMLPPQNSGLLPPPALPPLPPEGLPRPPPELGSPEPFSSPPAPPPPPPRGDIPEPAMGFVLLAAAAGAGWAARRFWTRSPDPGAGRVPRSSDP